jgi:hypothetical protein
MARRGRRVARILIVGGGCRGRRFAEAMVEPGHAVGATTRDEARRAAIEATGAECWIGTPDRLATLRGAFADVTVACWMLACARGSAEEIEPLHSSRLEFFLSQAIDTTARGLIYDAWVVPGAAGGARVAGGARGAAWADEEGTAWADDGATGTADAAVAQRPDTGARRPTREMLAEGARIFRSLTALNAIPAVVLGDAEQRAGDVRVPGSVAAPGAGEGPGGVDALGDRDAPWLAAAEDAVAALLGGEG